MAGTSEPLCFRGVPHRLLLSSRALAGYHSGRIVLPDSLAGYQEGGAAALPVRHSRSKGPSLRLSLGHTAPAGSYQAQLNLHDRSVPVGLEIAPAPRLTMFPLSADFIGQAGDDPVVPVTLANIGNVAITVPDRFVAGMFDDDGLEMAFAETYRQPTDDPLELAGFWLRALRSGYGGLLKLRVTSGAGLLLPGDETRLDVTAHVPETLKPGHSYHGIWKLGPMHYRLSVAVRRKGDA